MRGLPIDHTTRRALWHWGQIILVLVAIAAVLWRVQVQDARVDALAEALTVEQEGVEDAGGTPIAPAPEELIEDPDAEITAGPSGPPGPGPSDAQVYAAVADYLRANPVTADGPSSAEIAAAVANYLADYPPGPTPEQVSAAVADYLTANPPEAGADGADGSPGPAGPSGPPGPQGEAGRAPTAEEIAAAVEEFMRDNPLPARCPDGYEFTSATLVTVSGPPLESVVCAEV